MFRTLGDPHLGRQFINGVPLERRGEREAMVWSRFELELKTKEPLHICMGDLFDKPIVSYRTIIRAASLYREAADARKTNYVILKGNHDWQRDLEAPSAFDLFHMLVQHEDRIKVITTPEVYEGYLFLPWHPTLETKEYDNLVDCTDVHVGFGHFDFDFGDHIIPTGWLSRHGITTFYNGHIHKPRTFKRDGVEVIGTGSMQPYAHGEESDDLLYVTVPYKSLATMDLRDLRNRCVRVLLGPNDTLDQKIDCLQLMIKKEGEAEDIGSVTLTDDFDMEKTFRESMEKAGVSDKLSKSILDQYDRMRLSSEV